MKLLKNSLILLFLFVISIAQGQKVYNLDASKAIPEVKYGHLKMGNPGQVGQELRVNSWYMTLAGKPIVPVMGEMHFSRYPREQWEDALLKMKANGINIVATYIFWIHHEELEGQFDWSGDKDFRAFVKLCHKLGLWVYPRIGPWCHGEVRNGGLPDWLLEKKFMKDRSNDPAYQAYVDRFIGEIAKQLNGLIYKDGGPVVGIQLENEYWRGKSGEQHILWLKQTVLAHGLDVPLYTVTGWGNASVPENEVIPLFGAYPAAPWTDNIKRLPLNDQYFFWPYRNDDKIGADVAGGNNKPYIDPSQYPFFTCEVGMGNQISYHRRPILGPLDGIALIQGKLGSGSNLPGYYVFTGGSNPHGLLTSMEENKDETSYWNEYPDISYDFQAAIGEYGQLAPSYQELKKIHYFLNAFGDRFAPTYPVFPVKKNGLEDLNYVVRINGNSGFIFIGNYLRHYGRPQYKQVQFKIKLASEELVFPEKTITIQDSCLAMWPINFALGTVNLKYATAQPVCVINESDRPSWFFVQNSDIVPEFAFDDQTVGAIESVGASITKKGGKTMVSDLKPGPDCIINFQDKSGNKQRLVVLSATDAKRIWLLSDKGKQHLYLSSSNLYQNNQTISAFDQSGKMEFSVFPALGKISVGGKELNGKQSGIFEQFTLQTPEQKPRITINPSPVFEPAQWLSLGEKADPERKLYKKIFLKEFCLNNPSAIKSARLVSFSGAPFELKVNESWTSAKPEANQLVVTDLTGYLQKGNNILYCIFPLNLAAGPFAATIEVDYMNTDRVLITTDPSWLTTESYILPSHFVDLTNLKAPEEYTGISPEFDSSKLPGKWRISVPANYMDGLNNIYLKMDYSGDVGRCYLRDRLVADNYFNGQSWTIGLKKFGEQLEGQSFDVSVTPLKPDYEMYFDIDQAQVKTGKAEIQQFKVVPEYKISFETDK